MVAEAKDVAPDTAARIRSVALDLFGRQGYEKTSLRQIAEELGITKAAVYYHYRSKVDILDDLLRPLADDEEMVLAEARSGLKSIEGRCRLVESYLDLLLKYRDVAVYVMSDIVGASNSSMVTTLQRHDRELVTLLAESDLSLSERVRVLSAIGAMTTILTMSDLPVDELRPLVLEAARDTLGLTKGDPDLGTSDP
ncbi:TetR/AcrR family transcriptional regulator [Phytoactinopolyspora halotolerans]|uniref:TetR/AcrR family transcriptional regulator n=1 Tax=Phytoactinopolyspora halotolerans TaxID=1981512 RepID=A0A6L9S8Q8_9ACTN|nr:TetR/AcrR family transcriptional regulator [Phytoactinopolyspora halotolerans]NEE00350.1 TetR/AcrR family transcriptional regulator [Phytoactinopolyspora halotolerans]